MKRLARLWLFLIAAAMLMTACDFKDGTAQPSCYEIDVDGPKRPALKAPTGPKVTAPALRVPKKGR